MTKTNSPSRSGHLKYEDNDSEAGEYEWRVSFPSRVISTIASVLRSRILINFVLFLAASLMLMGVSFIAYWTFYYQYIPKVSLEREVHLQFGEGNPFGIANIGPDIIANQNYDVSVHLYLPKTPANSAAGNFMLDLDLYSKDALPPFPSSPPLQEGVVLAAGSDDGCDYSSDPKSLLPFRLIQSRRTAILPYTSYLVSLAYRVVRLPIYVLGLGWEAEHLRIPMLERVSFARDSTDKNIPALVKLSIDSIERMQIYKATVRFDAKFSGLRWFMYNWKTSSLLLLGSWFWVVSIFAAIVAWSWLSSSSPDLDTKREDDVSSIANEFHNNEKEEESHDDESGGTLGEHVKEEVKKEESPMPEIKQEKQEDDYDYNNDIDILRRPIESTPLSNQTNLVREGGEPRHMDQEERDDVDNLAMIQSLLTAENEAVGRTTQSQREDGENERESESTRHRPNPKREEEEE